MPSPEDVANAARRRRETVAYITGHSRAHGRPPTYGELARHFSVSLTTTTRDLKWLRAHGQVTWERNSARTLRVTKTSP